MPNLARLAKEASDSLQRIQLLSLLLPKIEHRKSDPWTYRNTDGHREGRTSAPPPPPQLLRTRLPFELPTL